MRYEDAYAKAHPFDRLLEDMLQPEMVRETVEIVKTAIEKGEKVNLIINNRARGNAPLIAREIAEKFVEKKEPMVSQQLGSMGSLGISVNCKNPPDELAILKKFLSSAK